MKKLEDNTREVQEEIRNENSLMAALSRGSRLKEPAVALASLKTVRPARKRLWQRLTRSTPCGRSWRNTCTRNPNE